MKLNRLYISIILNAVLVTSPVFANEYSTYKNTGIEAISKNLNYRGFNLTQDEKNALKSIEDFYFYESYESKYQDYIDALEGVNLGSMPLSNMVMKSARHEKTSSIDYINATNAIYKISEKSEIDVDFNKHFSNVSDSEKFIGDNTNWSVINSGLNETLSERQEVINRRQSFYSVTLEELNRLGIALDFGVSAGGAMLDYVTSQHNIAKSGINKARQAMNIASDAKKIDEATKQYLLITDLTLNAMNLVNTSYSNATDPSIKGGLSQVNTTIDFIEAMEPISNLKERDFNAQNQIGSAKIGEAILEAGSVILAEQKIRQLDELGMTGNADIDTYLELARMQLIGERNRGAFKTISLLSKASEDLGSPLRLTNTIDAIDKLLNAFSPDQQKLLSYKYKINDQESKFDKIYYDIDRSIVAAVIASRNELANAVGKKIITEGETESSALKIPHKKKHNKSNKQSNEDNKPKIDDSNDSEPDSELIDNQNNDAKNQEDEDALKAEQKREEEKLKRVKESNARLKKYNERQDYLKTRKVELETDYQRQKSYIEDKTTRLNQSIVNGTSTLSASEIEDLRAKLEQDMINLNATRQQLINVTAELDDTPTLYLDDSNTIAQNKQAELDSNRNAKLSNIYNKIQTKDSEINKLMNSIVELRAIKNPTNAQRTKLNALENTLKKRVNEKDVLLSEYDASITDISDSQTMANNRKIDELKRESSTYLQQALDYKKEIERLTAISNRTEREEGELTKNRSLFVKSLQNAEQSLLQSAKLTGELPAEYSGLQVLINSTKDDSNFIGLDSAPTPSTPTVVVSEDDILAKDTNRSSENNQDGDVIQGDPEYVIRQFRENPNLIDDMFDEETMSGGEVRSFQKILERRLNRLEGGNWTGVNYKKDGSIDKEEDRLRDLKNDLYEAERDKKYDEANRLRAEISNSETKLNNWKAEYDFLRDRFFEIERRVDGLRDVRSDQVRVIKDLYAQADSFNSQTNQEDIEKLEEQLNRESDVMLQMLTVQLGLTDKDASNYQRIIDYYNEVANNKIVYAQLLDDLINGKVMDDYADDQYRIIDDLIAQNEVEDLPTEPETPTEPNIPTIPVVPTEPTPATPTFTASDFELELSIPEDNDFVLARLASSSVTDNIQQFELVSDAEHGSLTLDNDGVYQYSPDSNFYGTDTYTFRVTDLDGNTQDFTVNINVESVNDAPVASDSTITTARNTQVQDTLSASDVDGDDIRFNVVTQPTSGTLTFDGEQYVYVPDINYLGSDRFEYEVSDGNGGSNVYAVDVEVNRGKDYDFPSTSIKADRSGNRVVVDTIANSDVVFEFIDKNSGDVLYAINEKSDDNGLLNFNITDTEVVGNILTQADGVMAYALDAEGNKTPILAFDLSKGFNESNRLVSLGSNQNIVTIDNSQEDRPWAGVYVEYSKNGSYEDGQFVSGGGYKGLKQSKQTAPLTPEGINDNQTDFLKLNYDMIPNYNGEYRYINDGYSLMREHSNSEDQNPDDSTSLKAQSDISLVDWVYGQPLVGLPQVGSMKFEGKLYGQYADEPKDLDIDSVTGNVSLTFYLSDSELSGHFDFYENNESIGKTEFTQYAYQLADDGIYTTQPYCLGKEDCNNNIELIGFFGGESEATPDETGGSFWATKPNSPSVNIVGVYKTKIRVIDTGSSGSLVGKPSVSSRPIAISTGEVETGGQAPENYDVSYIGGSEGGAANDPNSVSWSWRSSGAGAISFNNEKDETLYGSYELISDTDVGDSNVQLLHIVPNGDGSETRFRTQSNSESNEFDYMSWGRWDKSEVDAGNVDNLKNAVGYWVYGKQNKSLPSTGEATYSGNVIGDYLPQSGSLEQGVIDGDIGMTMDFSSGTLDGSMNLNKNGQEWANATFNQSNSIEGSTFSVDRENMTVIGGGNGVMEGFFAGPNVEEIGGSFAIDKQHGDMGKATGIFTGTKQ